ncbi:MAG: FAD-binding oxidoreductase, partial [Deltaproteobacteria bacterium]|nr:FAD-binding oxidoreductase [Deltaproteobacteria bacterium]
MSSLVGELESIVGPDGCLHRPEELLVYECDGSTLHSGKPSAVVLPRSREEVCGVVSTCRAHGVPFVPRGAGTGLSGGAVANDGAVIIECSRMNRILEVNVEDRYAIVEPGVINAD